jgi:hypothetical protein
METPQSGNLWVLRVILLLSIYCAGVSFAAPASLGRQQTETSAAPQEYDLKEYEVELDRCSESLKNSSEIHNLRSSLAPTWHVHVGKTSVEMSTEPIAAELRKLDARPQDAANITRDLSLRLGAMRKAAAEMETSGEREKPEAARKRLDQIRYQANQVLTSKHSRAACLIAKQRSCTCVKKTGLSSGTIFFRSRLLKLRLKASTTFTTVSLLSTVYRS